MPSPPDDHRETARTSAFEWAVAALGLLLVLGTLGFLLYDARTGGTEPPVLSVRVDSVTRAGAQWLVHFTAGNAGRRTASAVTVSGGLAGAAPETSAVTLDYVPGRSRRRGGLLFSADPRAGRLRLRVEGFEEP